MICALQLYFNFGSISYTIYLGRNYSSYLQGCMNNLTFGDEQMGYYETIAGGAGAGPHWNGRSGVHTHMTNTRITDPEIFERRFPVVLHEFSLREDSGGHGKYRGGDGVVREVGVRVFLEPEQAVVWPLKVLPQIDHMLATGRDWQQASCQSEGCAFCFNSGDRPFRHGQQSSQAPSFSM